MKTLLLEIGTEEIPAGYIEPALAVLAARVSKQLTDLHIEYGTTRTYGTPKRLALKIDDLAERQQPVTSEVTGPPKSVAFDEEGNALIPAKKFAEKVGITIDEITIKETKKGAYLCAQTTDSGRETKEILAELLPEIILNLPFPKTMHWSKFKITFARPIQSILAMLGAEVIHFQLENLKSDKYAFGHRFLSPGKIKINEPLDYLPQLERAYVLADIEKRKQMIVREIDKVAAKLKGRVLPDPELIDIVTNLVEYPVPVAGQFDTKYLELPDEMLITSMREHQKYFAVVDEKDKLMPCFIAVNNTKARNLDLVANGHSRVLRARLEDGRFFYKSDLKAGMESWIEKLNGVLFQAQLGSVYKKTERIKDLAEYIAQKQKLTAGQVETVMRAAQLCKADLVSQVVVEFPKLQGVMGRIYAAKGGETEAVAEAIEDHYRPTYSGGPLPESETGAIVAIADKIDSICGCFSVGLLPTGASDPYALRRQGIGIVQIIRNQGFTFNLTGLIDKSLDLLKDKSNQDPALVKTQVYTFLQNRIAHSMVDEGFSKDVVAAVVAVSVDQIINAWDRVKALENLKTAPDFEPLAEAFKRVVNIIKKADIGEDLAINNALFQETAETALFEAYEQIKAKVAGYLETGQIDQALLDIASLKDAVDTFFNDVMVMTEDPAVRANRLALLRQIAKLFENIADFSKIQS